MFAEPSHPERFKTEWKIFGSDYVKIASVSDDNNHSRTLVVTIGIDTTTVPGGSANSDMVLRAAKRVRDRIRLLLNEEELTAGNPQIAVTCTFSSGAVALGVANVTHSLVMYSTVLTNLSTTYVDADPEGFETSIYLQLPVGSTVPVVVGPSGSNSSISKIRVASPLYHKWNAAFYPPVEIVFDADESWDFNSANGVPAGKYDFEQTLMHELLHAMGFHSRADRGPPFDEMTILDIIRFDGSIVGPSVSAAEFLGARRPLIATTTAVSGLDTNSTTYTVSMSTGENAGDGYAAGHWKEFTGSSTIGLMDPAQAKGKSPFGSKYVPIMDMRALDLIGWAVSQLYIINNIPIPEPAALLSLMMVLRMRHSVPLWNGAIQMQTVRCSKLMCMLSPKEKTISTMQSSLQLTSRRLACRFRQVS